MSPGALCPSTAGSGTAEALGEPAGVWRSARPLWRPERASSLPFHLLHRERASRGMKRDSQGQASRPAASTGGSQLCAWRRPALRERARQSARAARECPSGPAGGDVARVR